MKKLLSRSALMVAILALSGQVSAQIATDACGYNAGNEYPVGTSCTTTAFNKPTSFTQTFTPTGCSGSNNDDAWGWFTATGYTTIITYTPSSGNPILHLFTGACGSLTQVACANNGGNGAAETITYTTTPGVNYMVRMQANASNNAITGTICIYTPAAPANDDPCGATSIGLNTSCSNTATTSLYASATTAVPDPPCANYGGRDVWYSFVANTNRSVRIRTSANGMTDSGVALYEATSCSSGFNLLGCSANGNGNMGELAVGNLTNGATYYVRVWGEGLQQGTFNICLISIAGDEPCAATSLPVGTSCSNTAGTNVNATPSSGVADPPCGNYQGGDVWFSFVAPTGGGVTVRSVSGGLTNSGIALYSASSCGSGFTLISCSANGNGNMGQISQGGLTPGTTYYVRVWGENGASGTFNMCVVGVANDGPCAATSLPVGSSCSNTGTTNVFASHTSEVADPPCGNYQGGDVWFSFVAPTSGGVTVRSVSGGLTDSGIALYSASACGAGFTLISCSANGNGNMGQISQGGLIPGTTYYVRAWGENGASGTFNMCVVGVANDGPCTATSLPVGTSCSNTGSTNVFASGTTEVPNPPCGSYQGGDVWFSFVAPTSGGVTVRSVSGGLTDSGIALYSASACGAGFTLISCSANGNGNMGQISQGGLTPGTTYYVRVWGENGASGTFNMCVVGVANDGPCTATSLPVGTSCSNTGSTNVFASGTTEVPDPPCGNYQGGDVWFTFVAPANGAVTVRTSSGGLTNSAVALYSASACNGTFTLLACATDGNGTMGQVQQYGLTPGTTYYVRVWGDNAANGTFNICVSTPAVVNDDPCGAVGLPVNGTCVNTSSTNVNATATAGIPDPGCAAYSGGDVWFTFVAPASGAVEMLTGANGMTDSGMALYSATACGGTFSLIDCNDDGNGLMSRINAGGLTPGTTYYIRVWGYGGSTGTFNICVRSAIPPPNDEPCNAIDLALTSNCTYSAYTNLDATATSGIPAPGCGNYAGGDVWFRFTATATALVTIRTTAGTLTNATMALYQANTCNGTFTLVACDNTSGPGNMPFMSLTPLELVPGATYYLRVWGNNGSTGTFNLCANTAPSGTSCVYALRMWDSQGDGWGGSTVTIQVGAGAPVNYTISNGDQETAYIPVNVGQAIQLSYTAAGGAQGEIRYVLQLGYGIVYADGPTPGTGLRYVAIADCQTAAASTSDCQGRTPVCGAQQINDNPTNTGLTAELNIHNRGCLGANERQGSWYSFTIATGGTLAFTIAPTNSADDYDFAVWGPYTSVSCPPLNTPTRCNYSGISGNTGLATTAANPSEGAGGPKWSTAMTVVAGQTYLLYISNFSQSGLAFSLTWQLTNGASIDCTLLPVELIAFEGKAVGSEVELAWATASETNSSHYVVERMNADGNYASIGSVSAIGFATSTTNYTLVDPAPLPGTNLYRLRSVDQDGSSTTSDVVAVIFRAAPGALRAFPNPTEGDLNIDLDVVHDGSHSLRILDASGRLVRVVQQSFAAGPQRFSTWVGELAAGPYEMTLEAPDGTVLQTGRLMKQ
ncbi:MAG: hypothetical protein JNL52_09370 [Flavobacteriales bacterium]|nr:hypothetical protein [Flavobacteriales bacterium]